ncbi:ABC transporter permease [Jiella pacifica]|uniref:ABC transporter permease subunit n=1 Tax=Jiella pacifica TaxID=2696469 RepID=A0A6N9SZN5_9HYPH|nr:ABC transporter permease [Jiella pacifica]NDW03169.1 ABC transporter permease subunit [Jiella pacifica]
MSEAVKHAMPVQRATTARPEFVREVTDTGYGVVEKPLGVFETLWGNAGLRKVGVLVFLACLWQAYGLWVNNDLLMPTFTQTVAALWTDVASGRLPAAAAASMKVLLQGYVAGLALAAILTALATASRIGSDLLDVLTAMFNPLPSIALLPLAMIWFGLGDPSIIFVLIHAVLWSVALNTHAGFRGVSPTWRMVGRNYGIGQIGYIWSILIPGAFPSILTGLKIGWAFAWRTLIAAELVFGSSSGGGGLGWYVFENKNSLEIPSVFAGLLTVILLGLVVENLVFRTVERLTVQRWGMQQ